MICYFEIPSKRFAVFHATSIMKAEICSEDEIVRLFKSRATMMSVLRDRKYPVKETDHISFEDFSSWAGDKDRPTLRKEMTLNYQKQVNKVNVKIMVLWLVEPKLGTNIRDIVSDMKSSETNNAIIIADDSATAWCKTLIRNLRTSDTEIYIHFYTMEETQFNIMNHELVPEHYICTPAEKKRLLSTYSLKKEQLPGIKLNDPVMRHLGAKVGQLIKIIRNSETQEGNKYVTYRIVR